MLRNLQDKLIKFTMFDANGKWKGTGTGKVMIVDQGKSIRVSIREHSLFTKETLVELFPWNTPDRYQCDVILSVKDDVKL